MLSMGFPAAASFLSSRSHASAALFLLRVRRAGLRPSDSLLTTSPRQAVLGSIHSVELAVKLSDLPRAPMAVGAVAQCNYRPGGHTPLAARFVECALGAIRKID
jgi:hypothetical protein